MTFVVDDAASAGLGGYAPAEAGFAPPGVARV